MAERKAFNFYKSYWEQMKLLNNKQKLDLFNSICMVQFLEVNISDIIFTDKITELVWTGIKHSVSTSLNGFISKNKGLGDGVTVPLSKGGAQQGEGEGQVQGKEQVQEEEEEKKKIKPKAVFIPPTPSQVIDFGIEKGYSLDGKKICDYYTSENPNKWIKGNGDTVKSWKKTVLSVWCKDENKIKPKEKLYTYFLQDRGTMKNRTEKQYRNDKKMYDENGWKIELLSTN